MHDLPVPRILKKLFNHNITPTSIAHKDLLTFFLAFSYSIPTLPSPPPSLCESIPHQQQSLLQEKHPTLTPQLCLCFPPHSVILYPLTAYPTTENNISFSPINHPLRLSLVPQSFLKCSFPYCCAPKSCSTCRFKAPIVTSS